MAMKKSILCLAGACALLFTACEDTSDLGTMQVNEKPALVSSNGVSSRFLIGNSIDLATYENLDLPVLHTEMKADFPTSAKTGGVLQLSSTPDFEEGTTVNVDMVAINDSEENDVRKADVAIEGNAWENAFVEFFGKAPYAKDMYVRYKLYINDGSQTLILPYQGEDWWPVYTVNVTPVDLKYDVRPSYSVFGSFLPDTGVEMIHGEGHEYDNPVFTAFVNVSEEQAAAGYTITISPTDDPSVVYGVEPGYESDLSGRLVLGGLPVKLPFGPWKIEANMITKMYTISIALDKLYVPSFGNNNSFTRNCGTLLTDDFITYTGAAYISKGFGLTGQPSLRGVLYTKGDTENSIKLDTGRILNDSNMIPVEKNGLYWLNVNLINKTADATLLETLGLVGEMTGWADGKDIALTPSKAQASQYTTWTGEVTFTKAGEQFKIRANGSWTTNFGGELDDLKWDGGNLLSPGAGTYKVTVNLLTHPYSITLVAK